jgi:hypothetical protein
MYNSTERMHEFDFSDSGANPVDAREYDEATGVNGEMITNELLRKASKQLKTVSYSN